MTYRQPGSRFVVLVWMMVCGFLLSGGNASAQGRDSLANGTVIGAAAGAAAGIVFTHAVRDSDLVFGQYARGALIFGAIGAGIGLGVDALLSSRSQGRTKPPRVTVTPTVWRGGRLVSVTLKIGTLEH